MNEEVKLKVSMPMFEVGELERFDSNIHSIVEEYSKMQLHEKDQILTQRIIMKQEEIEELQNKLQQKEDIIKEAREYIKEHIRIDDEYPNYMEMLLEDYKELLEILDKENK